MAGPVVVSAASAAGLFLSDGGVALHLVGGALLTLAAWVALFYLVLRLFRVGSRQWLGRDFKLMFARPARRPEKWWFEAYDIEKGREVVGPMRGLAFLNGFRDVTGKRLGEPELPVEGGVVEGVEAMFVGLGVLDYQQDWWDPEHPDSRPGGVVRPGAAAGASVSPSHEFVGPVMPPWVQDGFPEDPGDYWADYWADPDPDAGEI